MVDPTTLPLETTLLALAALSIALAGVLWALLLPPRVRRAAPDRPTRRTADDLRSDLGGFAAVLAVGTIAAAAVVAVSSVRIGPALAVDEAIFAGAIGGLLAAAATAALVRLTPDPRRDLEIRPNEPRQIRREWMVATAVASAAGGLAVGTLVLLYLAFDGHVPTMIGVALGGGLAALAGRARTGGEPGAPLRGTGSVALPVRATMARALDLYSILLCAGVGSALLAYVPSVVRTLHPNAVLFPILALAATLLASVVGATFGAVVASPSRGSSAVATAAIVALSGVALLAVVPSFLDGSATLLASAVCGSVGGGAIFLASGFWRSATSAPQSGAQRLGLPFVTAMVVLLAFRFGSGAWIGGSVTDPSLGAYGLGLASVALAGALGGLLVVDTQRRLHSSAETIMNPAASSPALEVPWASVDLAGALALVLGSIVLLLAALALIPLEIGVAPVDLVGMTVLSAPGLLVALVIGMALPPGARWLMSERGSKGEVTSRREILRRGHIPELALVGVAIAAPFGAGWALGTPGLFGLGAGAVLAALASSGARDGPGGTPAAEVDIAPSLVRLVVVAIAVFGGAVLAGSLTGHL